MSWIILLASGVLEAVWVGVGAGLTIIWAMITGAESASVLKILLVLGIVACVIGLTIVSDAEH